MSEWVSGVYKNTCILNDKRHVVSTPAASDAAEERRRGTPEPLAEDDEEEKEADALEREREEAVRMVVVGSSLV